MQTAIDFTKPIIHRENNPDSQKQFEENETRFRGQCKTIMEAFKRGERLTTMSAMINYKIGDLRRRLKDLRDNYNVDYIQEETLKGGYKEWFI